MNSLLTRLSQSGRRRVLQPSAPAQAGRIFRTACCALLPVGRLVAAENALVGHRPVDMAVRFAVGHQPSPCPQRAHGVHAMLCVEQASHFTTGRTWAVLHTAPEAHTNDRRPGSQRARSTISIASGTAGSRFHLLRELRWTGYRLQPLSAARQCEVGGFAGLVHYVAAICTVAAFDCHDVTELRKARSAHSSDAEFVARLCLAVINHGAFPFV